MIDGSNLIAAALAGAALVGAIFSFVESEFLMGVVFLMLVVVNAVFAVSL